MAYRPEIHHRRSVRLRDFDYATTGAYFVTICTHERQCLFGDIVGGVMGLNDAGRVVRECWAAIPGHFGQCVLDEFVIMPNHFHGIIQIVGAGSPRPGLGCQHPGSSNRKTGGGKPEGGETPPLRWATLGQMVGYFKYQSTKRINTRRQTPGAPVWQRNYFERIVRGDRERDAIRQYIVANPAQWDHDRYRPGMT